MGMAPTGKSIVKPIDVMRCDDAGTAREHSGLVDMFSMMQQLGAIPEGPPAHGQGKHEQARRAASRRMRR
jgi:hypothetical protein